MKFFSFLIIIVIFSSCSLKDALDRGVGNAETKIEPIAKAKGITQDLLSGSTLTIKVPLSESSIAPIELDTFLNSNSENPGEVSASSADTLVEADNKVKKILKKIMRNFKLSVFNLALAMGYKNKVKFPMAFNLFEIDPQYIESAMVKRMFLTTDDCRENEENCKGKEGVESNFSLIENLKINVDTFDHVRDRHLEDGDYSNDVVFLGRDNRDEVESLKSEDAFNSFRIEDVISPSGETRKKLPGQNVLSFNNNIPYLNFKESRGAYLVKINNTQEMARIRKYLSSSKFDDVIEKTFIKRQFRRRSLGGVGNNNELRIILKENKTIDDLHYVINADLVPELNNTLIFRLNDKVHGANRYFKKAHYKGLIKDITVINKSLFVEVTDKKEFIKKMKSDEQDISECMDIHKVQNCNVSTCLNLKSKKHNFVPLLARSSKLKIDLYTAIRSLGYVDFKINGFIEIEIKLKTSGSKLL